MRILTGCPAGVYSAVIAGDWAQSAGRVAASQQDIDGAGAAIDGARAAVGEHVVAAREPARDGNFEYGAAGSGAKPLAVNDAHAAKSVGHAIFEKAGDQGMRFGSGPAVQVEHGLHRYGAASQATHQAVLYAGRYVFRRRLGAGFVGIV